MSSRTLAWFAGTLSVCLFALSGAAVEPKKERVVGVAPFVAASGEQGSVPAVAHQLAQRLSTLGIRQVVPLGEQGAPALTGSDVEAVKHWAEQAGVDVVVLGKTTRLGNRLSFDGHLRSGKTGQRMGNPFFVEAPATDGLSGAVDTLANRVMAQLGDATPAKVDEEEEKKPTTLLGTNSDDPVSIKSDQLEAVENDSGRTLVFTGNVRVVQGDMNLTSERAEAFYPPGGSQPEKMKATGQVVMRSAERIARCEEATFQRNNDLIVCRQRARIDDGCDRITADEIHFNTRTEKFFARGNVQVQMNREDPKCGGAS